MIPVYLHPDVLSSPSIMRLPEAQRAFAPWDWLASAPDAFGCFEMRVEIIHARLVTTFPNLKLSATRRRFEAYADPDDPVLEVWEAAGRVWGHWIAWFRPVRSGKFAGRMNRFRRDYARHTPIPPSLAHVDGDPTQVTDWDEVKEAARKPRGLVTDLYYQEPKNNQEPKTTKNLNTMPHARRAALVARLAEVLWNQAPKIARRRSSKKDLRLAVERASRENGGLPEPEAVVAALEAWIACPEWTKDGGAFIEGIHRWVKRRRWENPPEAEKAPQPKSWTPEDEEARTKRIRERLGRKS